MIRIAMEPFEMLNANRPENTPLFHCDNCLSYFVFAQMTPIQEGGRVFPITGSQLVHVLCKYCPACGARNTAPNPKNKESNNA